MYVYIFREPACDVENSAIESTGLEFYANAILDDKIDVDVLATAIHTGQ